MADEMKLNEEDLEDMDLDDIFDGAENGIDNAEIPEEEAPVQDEPAQEETAKEESKGTPKFTFKATKGDIGDNKPSVSFGNKEIKDLMKAPDAKNGLSQEGVDALNAMKDAVLPNATKFVDKIADKANTKVTAVILPKYEKEEFRGQKMAAIEDGKLKMSTYTDKSGAVKESTPTIDAKIKVGNKDYHITSNVTAKGYPYGNFKITTFENKKPVTLAAKEETKPDKNGNVIPGMDKVALPKEVAAVAQEWAKDIDSRTKIASNSKSDKSLLFDSAKNFKDVAEAKTTVTDKDGNAKEANAVYIKVQDGSEKKTEDGKTIKYDAEAEIRVHGADNMLVAKVSPYNEIQVKEKSFVKDADGKDTVKSGKFVTVSEENNQKISDMIEKFPEDVQKDIFNAINTISQTVNEARGDMDRNGNFGQSKVSQIAQNFNHSNKENSFAVFNKENNNLKIIITDNNKTEDGKTKKIDEVQISSYTDKNGNKQISAMVDIPNAEDRAAGKKPKFINNLDALNERADANNWPQAAKAAVAEAKHIDGVEYPKAKERQQGLEQG